MAKNILIYPNWSDKNDKMIPIYKLCPMLKATTMKKIVLILLIILNSLMSYPQTKWTETIKFKNFVVDITNFKSECSPCLDNTNPLDTFSIAENPC